MDGDITITKDWFDYTVLVLQSVLPALGIIATVLIAWVIRERIEKDRQRSEDVALISALTKNLAPQDHHGAALSLMLRALRDENVDVAEIALRATGYLQRTPDWAVDSSWGDLVPMRVRQQVSGVTVVGFTESGRYVLGAVFGQVAFFPASVAVVAIFGGQDGRLALADHGPRKCVGELAAFEIHAPTISSAVRFSDEFASSSHLCCLQVGQEGRRLVPHDFVASTRVESSGEALLVPSGADVVLEEAGVAFEVGTGNIVGVFDRRGRVVTVPSSMKE